MFRRIALAIGSLAVLASLASPAAAFVWDDKVLDCDNSHVLNRIEARFRHQVRHVPNLPDVEITGFDRIRQHRFLPASERSPVARRYCKATATLSDGRRRSVWYLIENGWGFASLGDGVEFCVAGFDRWKVYDAWCRVLR